MGWHHYYHCNYLAVAIFTRGKFGPGGTGVVNFEVRMASN